VVEIAVPVGVVEKGKTTARFVDLVNYLLPVRMRRDPHCVPYVQNVRAIG